MNNILENTAYWEESDFRRCENQIANGKWQFVVDVLECRDFYTRRAKNDTLSTVQNASFFGLLVEYSQNQIEDFGQEKINAICPVEIVFRTQQNVTDSNIGFLETRRNQLAYLQLMFDDAPELQEGMTAGLMSSLPNGAAYLSLTVSTTQGFRKHSKVDGGKIYVSASFPLESAFSNRIFGFVEARIIEPTDLMTGLDCAKYWSSTRLRR